MGIHPTGERSRSIGAKAGVAASPFTRAILLSGVWIGLLALPTAVHAQTTAAPPSSIVTTSTATFSGSDLDLSPQELETLVSRIALYPDDLLALVLPASTQPLQIVEAQRLLDQRKSNRKVQPPSDPGTPAWWRC